MARVATKKKPATRKRKAKARTRRVDRTTTLAPQTEIAEPSSRCVYVPRTSGVRVTEDTALTLPAVFACVRVITEDIAGMPWHVHERRKGGGSDPRPEDPADWLLQTQASPETSAFQWRETIIAHALTWGNGYAEIERDGAGRPVWLWTLTPDRVTPTRAEDGRLIYEVINGGSVPTYLESEDVFHLRGLGFDGLCGYSVIQLAARSIGIGIAIEQSAGDIFENDSTPGGVLTHPGQLSDQAIDKLRADWEKRHSKKKRRLAILEEGMKWEQTGLPPEDTRLIEQRQFTPADICRWFRVSPHKIADLSRATFSNIEHLNKAHVTDALLPWIRRLETEANIKLFGRTNRGRRFTRINPKALLRGDTAAQTEHISKMLGFGVYDINEARDYLDQNPIPDGHKRFVPVNMQLLEKAGQEPSPPPAAIVKDASTAAENDASSVASDEASPSAADDTLRAARIEAACMPLLEQACQRILTREERIASKGKPDEADRRDFALKQLDPSVLAVAAIYGIAGEGLAAAFVESHAQTAPTSPREMAAAIKELIRSRADT
jgi:HK97 family phage portal protein